MEADKWASQKAEQVRRQRDGRDLQQKTRLHDSELRAKYAQELWNELRGELKSRVELLNRELGDESLEWHDEVKQSEVKIGIKGSSSEVVLAFEPQFERVSGMVLHSHVSYGAAVRDGKVVFTDGSTTAPIQVIAEKVLDAVIKAL